VRNTFHPENLRKINSLTKYPSILTYHVMGDKGRLRDEVQVSFADGPLEVTEKVDGTNGRIVVNSDGDWVIGSREDLLTARGDRIFNSAQRIVETLRGIADNLPRSPHPDVLTTYYLEVYGGRVGSNACNYTASRWLTGCRLFDVAYTPALPEKLTWDLEKIANWRDNHGQSFMRGHDLDSIAESCGLQRVPADLTVGVQMPTTLHDTYVWLHDRVPVSTVTLDSTGNGHAEGVVVRTFDRSRIAKIRFQDYRRTLGPLKLDKE
jgi:hypothetical protein